MLPLMVTNVISLIAVGLYLVASAMLALPPSTTSARSRTAALALAAAAAVMHAGLALGFDHGGPSLHFFAALSLVGVGVAAITLVVNLFRPIAALGVVVFPLAALLLCLDAFAPSPAAAESMEWQITLHVAIALIAYSLLSIAALLAILLSLQERALRRHRVDSSLLHALPPLTLTESLLFRLIAAGFVMLTLTLVTGVLFVDDLLAQHLVHKTVLSIASWLVFGLLLYGRWRWGWRGPRAVRLTLMGMAVLLLAFFGTKFVLELVLHRTV